MKILVQEIKFFIVTLIIVLFFILIYFIFKKRNLEIDSLNKDIKIKEKQIEKLQKDKDSLNYLLQ